MRFEYYDPPAAVARFKHKEKGLYVYYLFWQWGAYRRARVLVRKMRFDYIMALTFGSLWMPTFMHWLPVPFIWGPVGGGEAVPFGLIPTLPWRARIPQYLRYVLMATLRLNPLVMGPIRRARLLLARTADTARLVPPRYADKVQVVLETAVADDLLSCGRHDQTPRDGTALRVIYTGRLVALKNVGAALQAVVIVVAKGTPVELVLVGDGPERQHLEDMASSLGIAGSVRFLGAVTQSRVMEELARSDVYVFPSLKEGGVWSLMEAMSVGLPVVCVNTSGMSIITDEYSAIRVAPISQEHLVAGFAEALTLLANSPERRKQLGENARRRIETLFRWDHKGDKMHALLLDLKATGK